MTEDERDGDAGRLADLLRRRADVYHPDRKKPSYYGDDDIDLLRKMVSDRDAALRDARAEEREACAQIAETESVPADDPQVNASLLVEQHGAVAVVQASVIATMRNIARRIRDRHNAVQKDNSSVLQDDLRDMLRALGMSDSARAQSPHEVFRECIAAVAVLRDHNTALAAVVQAARDQLGRGHRQECDFLADPDRFTEQDEYELCNCGIYAISEALARLDSGVVDAGWRSGTHPEKETLVLCWPRDEEHATAHWDGERWLGPRVL